MSNFPPLRLQVFKNDEKLADRESHSWTKNHYIYLFNLGACLNASNAIMTASNLVCVQTDGSQNNTVQNTLHQLYNIGDVLGGLNDDDEGIVVGSGTTAESWNDYALVSQISNGTGTGQLQYATQNNPGFSGDKTLTYSRGFANNSASGVDVNEIGLIFNTYYTSFNNKYILMARDVLDSTITVNNGETLTVNYIMTLNYPG